MVDLEWLDEQPSESETAHVRHVAVEQPLAITLNGRTRQGMVLRIEN
jgi:hypothetical protein